MNSTDSFRVGLLLLLFLAVPVGAAEPVAEVSAAVADSVPAQPVILEGGTKVYEARHRYTGVGEYDPGARFAPIEEVGQSASFGPVPQGDYGTDAFKPDYRANR